MKRSRLRFVFWPVGIVAAVVILFSLIFCIWALWVQPADSVALESLSSNEKVSFSDDRWIVFKPVNSPAKTGFIFYPGARVDPRAYASLARNVAENGFVVVVPGMPLNMALFAPDTAAEIMVHFPDIENWAIGGHSMGGAFAAQFATRNEKLIKGLVLMGAYPPPTTDLSKSNVSVVSIYGSRDGIAVPDEVLGGAKLLPPSTKWIEITGGNHAQFGRYGTQSGDMEATITIFDQQQITGDAIVSLLRSIDGG